MDSSGEMKTNQLNLKWNDFTYNIINSLELSLDNQDFVDVTLVCEEGSIRAHRLVLSACSTFFKRVLRENVCSHPIVVLKGIALSDLETLLMFMYHGEARILEQNVTRLLEAAQFLEIRGLTSHEYSQAPAESATTIDVIDRKPNSNDFPQIGFHSTTQENNEPFSPADLPFISSNRSKSQQTNGNVDQENMTESSNIVIKEEPPDEERCNLQVFPIIVSSQSMPITEALKPDENINSCFPESNFTDHEMTVLQQQRKLAFYEPRPCPKCRKMYRDAATLRNHLSIMHKVLCHKIACSCGSLFPTKHDLYVHRKKEHKR